MFSLKYKECEPTETIQNIKNILIKNNIFVTEKKWWNKDDELLPKSVLLKLNGLPFSVNGKGVNKHFALASAYAEFMERFQNIAMIRSFFRLDPDSNSYLKTPDRKLCNEKFLAELQDSECFQQTEIEIIRKLFKKKNELFGRLGMVKYVHVNSHKIVYLPDEYISFCTGSNGMCAGNSYSEALMQGLCEVFERKVLKELYSKEDILLPKIPEKFLNNVYLCNLLKYFKSLGYKVSIRDCSLNKGYPVVGLFIQTKKAIRFNLGAAPDFDIALERCFTEILQGKNHKDFANWLINIDDEETKNTAERKYWRKQLMKSFVSYSGSIKEKLLSNKEVGKDSLFSFRGKNNKETVENLLKIFTFEGKNVYIRDVSFLNFPAFHIFIPSVSDIIDRQVEDAAFYKAIPKASKILRNLQAATYSDILLLIKTIRTISEMTADESEVISVILRIPKTDKTNLFDLNYLLCILHFYVKDYKTALSFVKKNNKNEASSCLYFILKELCTCDNIQEVKQKKIFHNKIIQKEVFHILENPSIISQYFIHLKESYKYDDLISFCQEAQKMINEYSFDQIFLQKYVSDLNLEKI